MQSERMALRAKLKSGETLGAITGLLGRNAIAATTVAIERVVLRHMHDQIIQLRASDPEATATLEQIIREEQEHHDTSAAHLPQGSLWQRVLDPIVSASTEVVI